MEDTITLARRLKAQHHFDQSQAEGIARAIHEHESEYLANKADVANLRTEMKGDIANLRTEVKGDIASLRTEVKGDIASLRTEMKSMEVRLMAWNTVLAGVILALVKLT